jgi:hypothetical protein
MEKQLSFYITYRTQNITYLLMCRKTTKTSPIPSAVRTGILPLQVRLHVALKKGGHDLHRLSYSLPSGGLRFWR